MAEVVLKEIHVTGDDLQETVVIMVVLHESLLIEAVFQKLF